MGDRFSEDNRPLSWPKAEPDKWAYLPVGMLLLMVAAFIFSVVWAALH
jgi:hypothetical protein